MLKISWAACAQSPTPGPPLAQPPPEQLGNPSPTLYLPLSANLQLDNAVANLLAALPLPVDLPLASPGVFASIKLAAQPPLAKVALTYNPAFAGAKATVAPLDGGMITGADGDRLFTIGPDGTLPFGFQPPARPGRYHVVVQLGGSEAIFSFDVADLSTPKPAP